MAAKSKPKASNPHSEMDREGYLVDALAQLERLAMVAEEAESYVAAVNAKHRALIVRAELDQLRETARRQSPPSSVDEHKAEILVEVRRLRTGATEAGSYVAAATLLKLERELLTVGEVERRQAAADRLANIPTDELEDEARALLAELGA